MPIRTGGCLCGAVRYESGGEPVFSLMCHCRDCQRQSGTAYVAAVRMPAAEFRITQGTPKRYLAKSDAGNEISRVFCGDCGAPLYVQVSTRPDLVGIRVASFDDPSWFKPDADIFRLALDIAQAPAEQILYIDNTAMFVQIAEGLGIRSILHTDYRSTCAKLASFGLRNDDEGVVHETS